MYPRLAFNSIQRWGWPWTSGHFLKAENISVCLHTWIMLGVESEGFMHTRRACLCLSACLAICLSTYLPIHSAAYLKDATNSFAKKVYSPFCPFKTRKTNLFLCTPVPASPRGVLSLSRLRLLNLSNAWRGCSRCEVEELAIEMSVCLLLATVQRWANHKPVGLSSGLMWLTGVLADGWLSSWLVLVILAEEPWFIIFDRIKKL